MAKLSLDIKTETTVVVYQNSPRTLAEADLKRPESYEEFYNDLAQRRGVEIIAYIWKTHLLGPLKSEDAKKVQFYVQTEKIAPAINGFIATEPQEQEDGTHIVGYIPESVYFG